MKRLGLSDFLELKEKRENKEQIVEYKSDFLNGSIMVKKISPYKVTEILDKTDEIEGGAMTKGAKANEELIFKHCPDLQNKELIKKYGCAEPYDIVLKVFDNNIGEVGKFAEFILTLYGLVDKKEKEKSQLGVDIKN